MNKELITVQSIEEMGMPRIIVMAIPIMLTFCLIEYWVSKKKKKDVYDTKDFWASLAVGSGNLIISALLQAGSMGIIIFCYNVSPFAIPITWWSFALCLLGLDFARYWAHRFGHVSRFWWTTHVVHHSSKVYNLGVSFRLSWIQQFKILFFLPIALMGFHPYVFFIVHQIEILYQFWIHSAYINKLPRFIEYFFTTPSHHRVHHSTNEQYIDKNYGSTLIIWDRMFGTFEPEVEQAVYGITKPLEKPYNPVYLVFHEFVDMCKLVLKAKSVKEAYQIVFGYPT